MDRWRVRYASIIEYANSNERLGNQNAAMQFRAQAFGVKECIDDLILMPARDRGDK
jgi:hypothetical protein